MKTCELLICWQSEPRLKGCRFSYTNLNYLSLVGEEGMRGRWTSSSLLSWKAIALLAMLKNKFSSYLKIHNLKKSCCACAFLLPSKHHTTGFSVRFTQGQKGMYSTLTFFFYRYIILFNGNSTGAIHPLLAHLSMWEHLWEVGLERNLQVY